MKTKIILTVTCLLLFAATGVAKTDYTTNIIPEMTGNTEPAGVASSSGANPAAAWKAFDHKLSGAETDNGWMPGPVPQWLQYQFNDGPKRVAKYKIRGCPAARTMAPRTWTFQGSNNGTDWAVLDAQADISFANSESKEFVVITPGDYSYYKINFTEKAASDEPSLMIDGFEMYEAAGPAN